MYYTDVSNVTENDTSFPTFSQNYVFVDRVLIEYIVVEVRVVSVIQSHLLSIRDSRDVCDDDDDVVVCLAMMMMVKEKKLQLLLSWGYLLLK